LSDLTRLSLKETRDGLRVKKFSALEVTDSYLGAIEKANPKLNAYISVEAEQARQMAKASDEKLLTGQGGALEGVPLGIKDLFATKGIHTQAASHILDGFKPEYESSITNNLWNDGAVMLGKLNMDEFAMGSSNESSYYGAVINPWKAEDNKDLVPGGSSGGSAAAVSAWLCAGATATDTGGSIRQPAAFTGTVGVKPTYGRCSRWGVVAFASSLDQAGPITRTVEDSALMLNSMAGFDVKDSTSVDLAVPDFAAAVERGVKGLTIGVPKEYRMEGMPQEIETLWQQGLAWLKAEGAIIKDISLPHTKYALPAYYIVAPAEASSNLARYDGVKYGLRVGGGSIDEMYENTRAKGFGAEVQRRVLIGTYVLSAGYYDAYYVRAQKVRTLIKRDFENVFNDGIDAILTPATPSAAFGVNDQEMKADPVKMYLNDIFTVTVNMAGLPAIAVPAGKDTAGLPLALQLIGKPFDEETLFAAGRVIERSANIDFTPKKWW
jgi:aspartyl-tRNA(Asn)/glutamyl-tRNA(Gln) amidotransferase subunit A